MVKKQQLLVLKSDSKDFLSFLQQWKMIRIIKGDSFLEVWDWMRKELNIELWKCLLTEQTDKVIEQILKKISPECKLSIQSILDCKK